MFFLCCLNSENHIFWRDEVIVYTKDNLDFGISNGDKKDDDDNSSKNVLCRCGDDKESNCQKILFLIHKE